jgi:hypothetical protein
MMENEQLQQRLIEIELECERRLSEFDQQHRDELEQLRSRLDLSMIETEQLRQRSIEIELECKRRLSESDQEHQDELEKLRLSMIETEQLRQRLIEMNLEFERRLTESDQEHRDEIEQLRSRLDLSTIETEQLQQRLIEIELECKRRLSESDQEHRNELEQLRSEYLTINDNRRQVEVTIAERDQNRIDESDRSIAERHAHLMLVEHRTTIDALRSKIEELSSEIALKDSKAVQMRLNEEAMHQRRGVNVDDDTDLDQLRDEITSLKSLLRAASDERDRLADDRHNLCTEIVSLNARVIDDEAQRIVIDELNQCIQRLIADNEQLTRAQLAVQNDPNVIRHQSSLEEENQLLRQCLNDSKRMGDELQLDELNCSLQIAVDSLQAEVWTLQVGAAVYQICIFMIPFGMLSCVSYRSRSFEQTKHTNTVLM